MSNKTNRFSRTALSGLLAAGLTLGTAAAFAQQDNATPAPSQDTSQQPMQRPGRMGHGPMNPDEQVAHMTKRYNLSADQQSQIKPILANQQQQMEALRGDSSTSRDDKMAKMMSIRQDSTTKIQAVLNDSQKQQYAADQQKMQDRRQQRMQGAPSASSAPSGPPAQ